MPSIAPNHKLIYLPPLDQCFTGAAPIISWTVAADLLAESKESTALQPFLEDKLTIQALTTSIRSTKIPNAQAKADFETRTASINVTQSDNGAYNLQQIKEDALWLVQHSNTDEVTALRTTVLEWQERPIRRLLHDDPNEVDRSGGRTSLRSTSLGSAGGAPNGRRDDVRVGTSDSRADQRARRSRLIRTWYQEQNGVLTVRMLLARCRLEQDFSIEGKRPIYIEASWPKWVDNLHERLCAIADSRQEYNDNGTAVMLHLIETVRTLTGSLEEAPLPNSDLEADSQFEATRHTGQQLLRLLRLAFVMFCAHAVDSRALIEWFRSMAHLHLLRDLPSLQAADADTAERIRSLVGITLVTNLDVDAVAFCTGSRDSGRFNILDTSSVEAVSTSLAMAIENATASAAPALALWSSIGSTLKIHGDDLSLDGVDRRDSQPSSQIFTRTTPKSPEATQAWKAYLNDLAPGDASVEHFMRAALQGFGLLHQLSDLTVDLENILGIHIFSPLTYFVTHSALLSCLESVCSTTNYDAPLIEAAVAILHGQNCWSEYGGGHRFPAAHRALVQQFIQHPYLHALFEEAVSRYPYEFRPLLLLAKALVSNSDDGRAIIHRIRELPTITDAVPKGFVGYEAARYQEHDNCLTLREHLALFPASSAKRLILPDATYYSGMVVGRNSFPEMSIPVYSEGFAITKDYPPVVTWNHTHSLITYVGTWLANANQGQLWRPMSDIDIHNISGDCLELVTQLLELTLLQDNVEEESEALLAEMDRALPQHSDIVTTVASILEAALPYSVNQSSGSTASVIASCLRFLAVAIKIVPGRVWPLLSQPGLFGTESGESELSIALSSSRPIAVNCMLWVSALDLFERLIDDVVDNAAARAQPKALSVSRFDDVRDLDPGVSSKQMSRIVTNFVRLALGVLQPIREPVEADIAARAARLLQRILHYSFGLMETSTPQLLSSFNLAGKYVAEYLVGNTTGANLTSLLSPLSPLAFQEANVWSSQSLRAFKGLASSYFHLLTDLLRLTVRYSSGIGPLAQQLCSAVAFLVKIFARHRNLRTPTTLLLTQAATVFGLDHSEVTSIFASLRPEVALDAAEVLSDGQDIGDDTMLTQLRWQFFSACAQAKQTSFICYLLTRRAPSFGAKSGTKPGQSSSTRKPTFDLSLDMLSTSTSIDSATHVAMLQFVTDALNQWPWSLHRVHSHPKFLTAMSGFLDSLQWEPSGKSTDDVRLLTHQTTAVSLICDIFSMCLYSTRISGDVSFVAQWAPRIPLLDQPGFKDPFYNKNLHQRFKHNFEDRFTELRLENFRLSAVKSTEESYYDLDLARRVLGSSESAEAVRTITGFRHEFQLANDNLCLVASQKQLIVRWQQLCLQLVKDAERDNKLPKKLAYIAHECLEANREAEENNSLFADLRSLRVELASAIVQKLVDMRYSAGGMHSMLSTAWAVTRAGKPDFDNAFRGTDAGYYRLCIKLVVLCLQAHGMADILPSTSDGSGPSGLEASDAPRLKTSAAHQHKGIMLEIAADVVARGFRSLASQLHESPTSVVPSDFVLVISTLQSLLQVRGIEGASFQSQLALRLCDFNLGQYATALFSWSDRISVSEDDLIYGDISISFLSEMSLLPSLAESLATDGVLSKLNTSSLMSYFQRGGGTGPFEVPLQAHKIWTRGILPIVLNVLLAVGAPFAAEAATFLNNYEPQLEVAANALDSKATPTQRDPTAGCITYNAACEAHTLALIAVILDQYRANDDADVPPLLWERGSVKEDVETWVQGTRAFLRERIVPTSEKEAVLGRSKPVGGNKDLCECQSRLEELILKELKGALFVLTTWSTQYLATSFWVRTY